MSCKSSKILIVGALPESSGIGGVTIFVQRLLQSLDKEGCTYDFIDYRVSLFRVFKGILSHKVVHLNVSNPYLIFIFVLFAKLLGKRVMFTQHGDYARYTGARAWCLKQAVRWCNIPIAINAKSYDQMHALNDMTQFVPAFIPPVVSLPLDETLLNLIEKQHAERKTICSTNASTYSVDKLGREIYGIQFLCEFFAKRAKEVLLVSDPSGKNKALYGEIYPFVHFIDYPHDFSELLKKVEISIRNTSTDGDSLSVKESLFYKTTTLCTDVVSRPDGVILFKYSDAVSLNNALEETEKSEVADVSIINGAEEMLRIYSHFCNK